MKKTLLFSLFLFFAVFTASAAYAVCYAPNCYGAIGFDRKTGQASQHTNYSSANAALSAVSKECPNCESVWFGNGCAAMSYSKSHNFVLHRAGGTDFDLSKNAALNDCWSRIRQIGLDKTNNDRRRSNRRTDERGSCEVVAAACTYREYWY